ncbi:MAG: holC [Paucimonas sp.]|nr:holC [Paucimonas sp.]
MAADMTRIDFHTKVPDKLQYTCKLLRRAAGEGWQVVVLCSDEGELARLDEILWTFSEQEFLPHVRAGDSLAPDTPIVLTARDDEALPHHRLLVNLSQASPAQFARFERLVEIVSTVKSDLDAGRERFAYYRNRGYPLTHHDRSVNEQPVA